MSSAFPPPDNTFSARARRDLSFLWPALFMPLRELQNFDWRKHQQLLALGVIGLAPLAIFGFLGNGLDIGGAYWCIAFYFSMFWFVCFWFFFRGSERFSPRLLALCYFGTSFFVLFVLLPLDSVPPLSWLAGAFEEQTFLPIRLALAAVAIGIPEELSKTAMLFVLWRMRLPLTPRSMLVYGLVCGLGFGIREGVLYQTGSNVVAAQGNVAIYYLENMLRLTSLPFLHAIWTGIAGYFIGYAYEYRQRQVGLLIIAIGLPAILHGCYDVFSDSFLGLAIAAFSVLVLGLYLHASEHFRTTLEERGTTDPLLDVGA